MNNRVLQHNCKTLDELISLMGIGVWDWDILNNSIYYNDMYLKMLGYNRYEMNGSVQEWKAMRHPEDLSRSEQLLEDHLAGKTPAYTCEIRLKHRNNSYIWMRDMAKVIMRDADGNPTRLLGGYLNINELKHSTQHLTEALEALELNHISLEEAVEKHNIEMMEQDKLLWTVNQISRKLLSVEPNEDFESLVQDCLRLLGENIGKNRVYIWKNCFNEKDQLCCTQIYEWVRGVMPTLGDKRFEKIPYDNLPAFEAAINSDKCLNCLLRDFSASEKNILLPQGIKTILIAPITINSNHWGFIGVDNCENEQLFTSIEESMLMMSGSMLASAIERMETEAALREMEERTQIMLNATPLCCNLWTPNFSNMSCNDEAVRLFELSSQKEYLDRFAELSPEYQPCGQRSNELAAKYIAKAFDEGYCRFEWMHQKLDGTPVPAEITLVRIKYKDGFIVAGYTRDLREQKAMLEELKTKEAFRIARDEALLSSKAKSKFLANMSHEIRTPMNAIAGFTEIILRDNSNEKITEYAMGMKSACGSLINIINDILDISKIESGKLEIFNASYDLASLLNDVITIARMRLGNKPLMFITNIDCKLPAQLVGDEARIKQILLNMLSNAIKYTEEGFIALRVSGKMTKDNVTLSFSVKDSGTGIKPDDLKRLFDEFERVNTTKNRSIEGTGLGLAISKQLCKMMGGHIQVSSVYGEGSEFVAVIPQECSSCERLSQIQEKKYILLYEPRESYRLSIIETLENLSCKCVSCTNQSELYHNIGAMPYDYVLTAALHLKKVQATMQRNNLAAPVAAFVDYGEVLDDNQVCAIFLPVNCLTMAALFNGQHEPGHPSRRNAANTPFVAPSIRVLVVDDNPVNLQVAKGLMKPYRFTIDTAGNGLEAVNMVQRTVYDLVFMDHMMPEMDGVDATAAIRSLEGRYYQTLPIIALTANALVGTREMFIREGMSDFLAKPIEMKKLSQLLLKWLPQSKIVKVSPPKPTNFIEESPALNITGINTAQGILSVGSSKEYYLLILSAYYNDGKQKCVSLPQHIAQKDIAAFQIEVHALKSASATIGAQEISLMAANMETAARANDTAFIDKNLDQFLSCFNAVLDAIQPFLPSVPPESTDGGKPSGDAIDLNNALNAMKDAMEIANIRQIEEELRQLQKFSWSKATTTELTTMQEHLSVFDYDGALACVNRLKAALPS